MKRRGQAEQTFSNQEKEKPCHSDSEKALKRRETAKGGSLAAARFVRFQTRRTGSGIAFGNAFRQKYLRHSGSVRPPPVRHD
jgi:hypothetical protein